MIRYARAVLLAAAAVFALTPAALASDHLMLGKGESRDLPLAGSAASVVVGDSAVADATVVSAHNVVVWGKKLGTSEVMAFDKNGHKLLDTVVAVGSGWSANDSGHLTVYRGVNTMEYGCSSRCVPMGTSASSSGDDGSNGPSPGAAGGGGASSSPALTMSAFTMSVKR